MPILRKIDNRNREYTAKKDNINYKAVYNTSTWRKLRLLYLSENPLCEKCIKKDKITPATQVHHIIPIDEGNSISEKKTLGYNWDNLEALCEECHQAEHKKRHKVNLIQWNNKEEKI